MNPRATSLIGSLSLAFALTCVAQQTTSPLAWPEIGSEQRPWCYWWWHGSAVDTTNITHELERFRDAGLGGVHIIPIYGTKGYEAQNIEYLSPKWMEMLRHTVTEANRLGLGVDMTAGSGWCFGGPQVTDVEANAQVVSRTYNVAEGASLPGKFDTNSIQALVAFSADGKADDLTSAIGADGSVSRTAPAGGWRVYAISQRPSGQKVKRAGPGGEGHMLNLFYGDAMKHYLTWFETAFANYTGPKPRAIYHDSYEYNSNWSPDFFEQFQKRRGYPLQSVLPALFSNEQSDRAARVKSDYRETISDLMAESTLPMWVEWSHQRGFITRNEAHGSPGNWLDLYAVADVPETEMFHTDRNKLVSKFASSAAHVAGRKFTGSETGTWLKEHFTETLADMKYLLDDLYLSGVNHVFYHGTCYSPDEAAWPGWLFYASYEMNSRNSIWHDVRALNDYAARCQAVLQSGKPDNDILIYWPIYDVWHNSTGMVQQFTVHARDWFEQQPIGKTAKQLWDRGYSFDYISDRQLSATKFANGKIETSGGNSYRVILVPPTEHIPLATLSNLFRLAGGGAIVIFENSMPKDVPGWGDLDKRRMQFGDFEIGNAVKRGPTRGSFSMAVSSGRMIVGEREFALKEAGVQREEMFDIPGLMCIRRSFGGGHSYFIANRSETNAVDTAVKLSVPAKSVVYMDPMTGRTGNGTSGAQMEGVAYLKLQPGQSIVLRCFDKAISAGPSFGDNVTNGSAVELTGIWDVKFVSGGPELPKSFSTNRLGSWTDSSDTNASRFAGTAVYKLTFDAPPSCRMQAWLDLGKVCQSARVRLNGKDLGTLITTPFRVETRDLKATGNVLEVEVTNVSANRIRDLDRRGVKWQIFNDINFVNIDYRPFNAANWPITDSGLLGPVTLTPITFVR